MKKRLRKKMAGKQREAKLIKSLKQAEMALNGDTSKVTTHVVYLNKKAPQ